jgi:sugar O-acyltransferase (sialic acid O-acetyltransferase NeuD family)
VAALGTSGRLRRLSVARKLPDQLVLVGSGGFGRETAEAVRAINAVDAGDGGRPPWELLGYLDDDESTWGRFMSDTPVLGPLDMLADLPHARVVICTGHPGNFMSKKRIVERLGLPPERYATLIHPSAVIPRSCRPGPGTVILAGAVATTDVEIGAHIGVMPQVVLTHDDQLADYVTLGAQACLAGRVRVEEGAYLGAGCQIRGDLTIGSWALVGMGAVVLHDVPSGQVWAGVPARPLQPQAAAIGSRA